MKVACVILALLAAVSLGAAIADIIYTVVVVCPKTTDVCPLGNLAIIFSYIGSGVWASLFVSLIILFITINYTLLSYVIISSAVG